VTDARTSQGELTKITQAYRYALDPAPEQVNLLRSHIGSTRFAYNTLLGLVKVNWDENREKKEAGEVGLPRHRPPRPPETLVRTSRRGGSVVE
jgi:hypothetical protein